MKKITPPGESVNSFLPTIIVDTREPLSTSWERYFSCPTARQRLETGDYSLFGLDHLVAVERKTLDDLIACFTAHRQRFEAELRRARAFDSFWVIVESDYPTLLNGHFRSKMSPRAAWESAAALMTRYEVPIIMAGDAYTGAKLCESLLLKWLRERTRVPELAQQAALRLSA